MEKYKPNRFAVGLSEMCLLRKGENCMIKGRKVYDPLTNTWSTGYWIVSTKGNYYPVWRGREENKNDRISKN